MIDFFRVEKNGKGPYCDDEERHIDNPEMLWWQTHNHLESEQTPIGVDDGIYVIKKIRVDSNEELKRKKIKFLNFYHLPNRLKFGFKSIDQLRSWFNDEEILNLLLNNYKILKFQIPESKIIFGGKQIAAFLKRSYYKSCIEISIDDL